MAVSYLLKMALKFVMQRQAGLLLSHIRDKAGYNIQALFYDQAYYCSSSDDSYGRRIA